MAEVEKLLELADAVELQGWRNVDFALGEGSFDGKPDLSAAEFAVSCFELAERIRAWNTRTTTGGDKCEVCRSNALLDTRCELHRDK